MDRTRRLARLLAPVALVGSIAVATQPAHAASAPQLSTAATPQLSTAATPQVAPQRPVLDFSIKICIGDHCVTISF